MGFFSLFKRSKIPVETPVQIAGSLVLETDPMKETGLDERKLQETVCIIALGITAGIEPHLVSEILPVHIEDIILVEIVQFGNPYIDNIGKAAGLHRIQNLHLRSQILHILCNPDV